MVMAFFGGKEGIFFASPSSIGQCLMDRCAPV